jgi:hypothetical protein
MLLAFLPQSLEDLKFYQKQCLWVTIKISTLKVTWFSSDQSRDSITCNKTAALKSSEPKDSLTKRLRATHCQPYLKTQIPGNHPENILQSPSLLMEMYLLFLKIELYRKDLSQLNKKRHGLFSSSCSVYHTFCWLAEELPDVKRTSYAYVEPMLKYLHVKTLDHLGHSSIISINTPCIILKRFDWNELLKQQILQSCLEGGLLLA